MYGFGCILPGTEVLQQTADRGWVELKRRSAVTVVGQVESMAESSTKWVKKG